MICIELLPNTAYITSPASSSDLLRMWASTQNSKTHHFRVLCSGACKYSLRYANLAIALYNLGYSINKILEMLASSPVFQNKNGSAVTLSSDQASHHKPLSKSNIQSKCMQFPSAEMQQQITALKQKAHQSFMQVIQMQQLHEQQVGQLRRQFQLKEESYQTQLNALELRVRQLEYQNLVLEKNYRQHNCNLDENELSIDNIDLISCKEESRLDQSSIFNFCELIGSSSYQEQINTVREELKGEFHAIHTQNDQQKKKVESMIDKLFEYVIHLKRQFISLQEIHWQAKKQLEQNEHKSVSSQNIYESLQKQTKFLGEQVNRLAGQKMKGQRRILQLQRKLKQCQRQDKKPDFIAMKKTDVPIRKSEPHQSNDNSLDMNEFIQKNLANNTKPGKEQISTRTAMFKKANN